MKKLNNRDTPIAKSLQVRATLIIHDFLRHVLRSPQGPEGMETVPDTARSRGRILNLRPPAICRISRTRISKGRPGTPPTPRTERARGSAPSNRNTPNLAIFGGFQRFWTISDVFQPAAKRLQSSFKNRRNSAIFVDFRSLISPPEGLRKNRPESPNLPGKSSRIAKFRHFRVRFGTASHPPQHQIAALGAPTRAGGPARRGPPWPQRRSTPGAPAQRESRTTIPTPTCGRFVSSYARMITSTYR